MEPVLKQSDIYRLVNRYIGVNGGYLGTFSYQSHFEFYPEYCDLHFDTHSMGGTTRERFIEILAKAVPRDQARIIRGALVKCPVASFDQQARPAKQSLHDELLALAARLDQVGVVAEPTLASAREVVEHALADAAVLLRDRGAASSVDRVHTAVHGYALSICTEAGIPHSTDDGLPRLFALIHSQHPAFGTGGHEEQVRKVIRSLAGAVDAVNNLRNNATPAHPNDVLLADPEAQLVLNAAKTLLHYVEARLGSWRKPTAAAQPVEDDDIPF